MVHKSFEMMLRTVEGRQLELVGDEGWKGAVVSTTVVAVTEAAGAKDLVEEVDWVFDSAEESKIPDSCR